MSVMMSTWSKEPCWFIKGSSIGQWRRTFGRVFIRWEEKEREAKGVYSLIY